MTTQAHLGPNVLAPDVLDGLPGVLIRVRLLDDGRAREVVGLDADHHHATGHLFASVRIMLDTLAAIWSDLTTLEAAPLRSWTARSGRYWLVGAGDRAWVLDSAQADIGAVFHRLEAV